MSSTAGGSPGALAYITPFLKAHREGRVSDHIHLGYWDRPPVGPVGHEDWKSAQARLVERLIAMADLADGQTVADVGCGIGGTLRAIRRRIRPALLMGINLDQRQLALCPGGDEEIARICANAVSLPLARARIDRMFCVEAEFHFASREGFLGEAARALRPGGRLVLSDILIDRDAVPRRLHRRIEIALRRDFGPWPEPWTGLPALRDALRANGFAIDLEQDATRETLPSYHIIAPGPLPDRLPEGIPATMVMRLLQERGALRYILLSALRQ